MGTRAVRRADGRGKADWDDGETNTPRGTVVFADPGRKRDKELLESIRGPDPSGTRWMSIGGWGLSEGREDDSRAYGEEDDGPMDWDRVQAMFEYMIRLVPLDERDRTRVAHEVIPRALADPIEMGATDTSADDEALAVALDKWQLKDDVPGEVVRFPDTNDALFSALTTKPVHIEAISYVLSHSTLCRYGDSDWRQSFASIKFVLAENPYLQRPHTKSLPHRLRPLFILLVYSMATFVDDADTQITYTPGWKVFANDGASVLGTKHGAASADLTATFSFTGTHVSVWGLVGSNDVHGWPITEYAIDRNVLGTFTAPQVDPPHFLINVTFFSSNTLAAGQHELTITNVNGTAPNTYWLDFLLFAPAVINLTTTPATTGATTAAAPSPSSSGILLTTGTDSSPSTSSAASKPTGGNDAAPSGSSSRSHTAAIAGGVVGGLAIVAIAAALVIFLRRRRGPRRASRLTLESDGSGDMMTQALPFVAQQASGSTGLSSKLALAAVHPVGGSRSDASMGRTFAEVDSGLRWANVGDGTVILPPPYTRE
ncbi:uncharacterized protein BXZ73DRAFT_99610 [Epithele typhae]|uniref:uncharacterized protein n=1 Tax=Epithele typhae TaxID=378194 RepID=UPI0020078B43|nr:uncharacterized protein BXZ73DRAFT_99610 [Epithele typhae]KAH9939404.1 hypothetical protein BXZ73DRAFT_99610 [Epithele typhae]